MARIYIWDSVEFVNCSCNFVDKENTTSEKYVIIISANSGYEFPTKDYLIFDDMWEEYKFTNYGDRLEFDTKTITRAEWNLDDENPYVAVEKGDTIPVLNISGNLINCFSNYLSGEPLDINKPIIITTNEGFIFKEDFINNIKDINNNYYSFTKENKNKLVFNISELDGDLELIGDIIAVEDVVEGLTSFTDIFKISDEELKELSKKRWLDSSFNYMDLGQYINNLFIFPIKIDDDYIGSRKNIYLGDTDTNVNSLVINNYEIIVDLGTIEVPELYNNVYDYINTRCILYLPYFDKMYLNNEYVINQSINIEYIINLYTGYATVNIRSSFTDTIIESKNSLIVTNIPYIHSKNVYGGFNNNMKNTFSKAYIEVVRNKPYNPTTPFGKDTIEYGKISDYTGFIECDNVVLNSKATNREKSEIETLLGKGVFINE